MRAITQQSLGGPEVLTVVDVPEPSNASPTRTGGSAVVTSWTSPSSRSGSRSDSVLQPRPGGAPTGPERTAGHFLVSPGPATALRRHR
jgi:hypothetical protein